ncbi:YchJ family protein [Thalassospira xiamenensis]|nr:YchJ family protein [Thalassospira xiamenensis]MCK2165439.1 YchJ family protein [Thalassospira xiamenensis]
MNMAKTDAISPCPCGAPKIFGKCCGELLSGKRKASTAEQLMWSRYSAFVTRDADYLLATLAPEKASGFDPEQIKADNNEWLGLEIIATHKGGILDQHGMVEFIARFHDNGRDHALHEISRFERRNGNWLYIDGEFPETSPGNITASPTNTGRNDPCPCGSGKKYKKCCG